MKAFLLLVLVAFAGCGSVEGLLRGDKPTARVKGVSLQGLALDGVTLRFDVEVYNPYGAALPLVDLGYSLASGGTPFLQGNAKPTGSVPAKGKKIIPLDARVEFASLLSALSGVRPGAVVPYDAKLDLSVEPAGLARINLPIQKSGEVPVPTVPKIELASIKWDKLSLTEARAVLKIGVENTNQFKLGLDTFGYKLALGGTSVASAQAKPSGSIGAGESTTIEIPVSLSPVSLGLGVFNMLRGNGSSYGLDGTMAVKTPFGPLAMPYSSSGQVPFSR